MISTDTKNIPAVRLEDFPIRVPANDATFEAGGPVAQQFGLPEGERLAFVSQIYRRMDGAPAATIGMRVVGVKKGRFEEIEISCAYFDADGQIVLWTEDLDLDQQAAAGRLRQYSGETAKSIDPAVKTTAKALQKSAKPATKKAATKKAAGPALTADAELVGIAVSRDRVAAVSRNTLWLWDASTGAPIAQMRLAGAGLKTLHDVKISPDGSRVAAGSTSISLIETSTGSVVHKLAGHPKGEVRGLAFSSDGATLASASNVRSRGADCSIALWSTHDGSQLRRIEAEAERLAFDENGTSIGVGSILLLQRLDVASGALASTPVSELWDVARVPGGWWVAERGGITPYSEALARGTTFVPEGLAGQSGVFRLGVGRERAVIACGPHAVVVDLASQRVTAKLELPAVPGMDAPYVGAVGMSADGTRVALTVGSLAVLYDGEGKRLLAS